MPKSLLIIIFLHLLAALILCGVGCDRTPARNTPEGTILATKYAVERGDARRIGQFIYAENEDYRRLFNRLGAFLGNVQKLGSAIETKFPDEVAALKAEAVEAAKNGKSVASLSTMISQIRGGSGGGGGNRRSRSPALGSGSDPRDAFDEGLKRLFADPYGWIAESEKRLTTTFLTDNSVALLWDEKPILPPIGMIMRQDSRDGLWYYVLPTNLPGVNNVMPKTKEQFEIFGGLIKVFDQVVIDLRNDIESGKLRTLDDVSRAAGEKTFIPAAMTVFAYAKLSENQKKEAREAKQPTETPPPADSK